MTDPGTRPAPDAPPDQPRDSLRGLLGIALAWTLVVTGLVAVGPVIAGNGAGFGDRPKPFRITAVDGIPQDRGVDGRSFTVDHDSVKIEVEISGSDDVECWNWDSNDSDHVTAYRGTWILELVLEPGANTIECTSHRVLGKSEAFGVTYAGGASPGPEASVTPGPSDEPDLFRITAIDGREQGQVADSTVTVHQPTVRIDLDQRSTATVTCLNLESGYSWRTAPRVAAQSLDIDLRPGTNTISCTSGSRPAQRVRFDVDFVVDTTASLDPAAVVITTVDSWPRNAIPDHGYTTQSRQILLRGSAPDPAAVVCTGAACEGQTVYATGATTWAVTLELADGTNRVEVHAAGDPSNADSVTVERIR